MSQIALPAAPTVLRRRGRGRDRIAMVLFLAPAAAYLSIFFAYPMYKNIAMSLQDYTTRTFYTGEAPFVGLDNYIAVLSAPLFGQSLRNTLLFTAGSLIGQFVIGMALAVFFQRRFPLNELLRSVLLLPWLLPLVATAAVWKWILEQDSGILNRALMALGLVDQGVPWLTSPQMALIAVILVNIWIGIPFNMVLLYGGLQGISRDVYEAAAMDGAVGWKAFWNITLPLLRPVILVVLILGIVYTVKTLDIILSLTGGGPANSTQTIASQAYGLSFGQFEFGQGSALGNVLVVMSIVFSFIYLRVNRRANELQG